jgi:hypothetical protein
MLLKGSEEAFDSPLLDDSSCNHSYMLLSNSSNSLLISHYRTLQKMIQKAKIRESHYVLRDPAGRALPTIQSVTASYLSLKNKRLKDAWVKVKC